MTPHFGFLQTPDSGITLATQDIQILRDEGIDDPGTVIAAAAAFLRLHPMHPVDPVKNALSEEEELILARHGAQGLHESLTTQSIRKNTVIIVSEYAQMVSTALSQKDTAECLEVSARRVRQRINQGSLYALESKRVRVCPRFQFNDASTLPGLEKVLQTIGGDAHPVVMQRFFLQANRDLVSEVTDQTLSPRDWLISGHDVEVVCRLASDI